MDDVQKLLKETIERLEESKKIIGESLIKIQIACPSDQLALEIEYVYIKNKACLSGLYDFYEAYARIPDINEQIYKMITKDDNENV